MGVNTNRVSKFGKNDKEDDLKSNISQSALSQTVYKAYLNNK